MSVDPFSRLYRASPTIGERLITTGGRPSGFDYMRVILSLGVICFHSIVTSYGQDAQAQFRTTIWAAPFFTILPLFFALSGFLVAGSLERCKTLVSFLGLRVLRIIPPLAVEISLSALVLGPLLTSLPLSSYFENRTFASYFLNILGDIHYELPGLFLDNPLPNRVNGQLWTIPYELVCYIALTAIAVTRIFKHRLLLLGLVVVLYAGAVLRSLTEPPINPGVVQGGTLVPTFIAGVLIYQYRDVLRWNAWLFILSILAMLACYETSHGHHFVALPGAYMAVYLGLCNPARNKRLLSGDYSYGLFLYGFPVQQALASFSPLLPSLVLESGRRYSVHVRNRRCFLVAY